MYKQDLEKGESREFSDELDIPFSKRQSIQCPCRNQESRPAQVGMQVSRKPTAYHGNIAQCFPACEPMRSSPGARHGVLCHDSAGSPCHCRRLHTRHLSGCVSSPAAQPGVLSGDWRLTGFLLRDLRLYLCEQNRKELPAVRVLLTESISPRTIPPPAGDISTLSRAAGWGVLEAPTTQGRASQATRVGRPTRQSPLGRGPGDVMGQGRCGDPRKCLLALVLTRLSHLPVDGKPGSYSQHFEGIVIGESPCLTLASWAGGTCCGVCPRPPGQPTVCPPAPPGRSTAAAQLGTRTLSEGAQWTPSRCGPAAGVCVWLGGVHWGLERTAAMVWGCSQRC